MSFVYYAIRPRTIKEFKKRFDIGKDITAFVRRKQCDICGDMLCKYHQYMCNKDEVCVNCYLVLYPPSEQTGTVIANSLKALVARAKENS